MKENHLKRTEELKTCPNCGNEFSCSSSGKCWCFEVFISSEKLKKIEENFNSCLCPDCLNKFSND